MAAGLRFGLRRAMWNIVGLITGIMFVLLVVAVGLDALLATSTVAFLVVKWLGVAYLVWLGVREAVNNHARCDGQAGERGGCADELTAVFVDFGGGVLRMLVIVHFLSAPIAVAGVAGAGTAVVCLGLLA